MSKNLKTVVLFFENLEYVVLPSFYFLELQVKEEQTTTFTISEQANRSVAQFEGDFYRPLLLFERLTKYSDITHIELVYDDETTEEFELNWSEEDDEYNRYQTFSFTDTGDLHIEIKPQ